MRNFKFRGYVIHSSRMWQQAQVDLAMDFMVKHGMNALIFHQNDLVEQLVFPEAYFDNDMMWDNWPVRRQGVLYQRDYINQVINFWRRNLRNCFLCILVLQVLSSVPGQERALSPLRPIAAAASAVRIHRLSTGM